MTKHKIARMSCEEYIAAFMPCGKPVTAVDIYAGVCCGKWAETTVRGCINSLARKGVLIQVGKGKWQKKERLGNF